MWFFTPSTKKKEKKKRIGAGLNRVNIHLLENSNSWDFTLAFSHFEQKCL